MMILKKTKFNPKNLSKKLGLL